MSPIRHFIWLYFSFWYFLSFFLRLFFIVVFCFSNIVSFESITLSHTLSQIQNVSYPKNDISSYLSFILHICCFIRFFYRSISGSFCNRNNGRYAFMNFMHRCRLLIKRSSKVKRRYLHAKQKQCPEMWQCAGSEKVHQCARLLRLKHVSPSVKMVH